VHCCHCRSCQREGGGAFILNALIETERVALLWGQVAVVDIPTDSGRGQAVARCPRCQVALWSHYAYAGIGEGVRFVRVGTLDQPDLLPPDIHIYAASRQAWLALPDDRPVMPAFYRASEYWPADSLARRAELFARFGR
jgi:hypothetical protein